MKIFKLAALLLLAAAAVIEIEMQVEIKNPRNVDRKGEVVGLNWKSLLAENDKLTPENARVLDSKGNTLLSQAVDNDGDGGIDELLFIADLAGGETKRFEARADASLKMPASEIRAYGRYVPERKDDFAWENDVAAFRVYGPALRDGPENCGIDCFMKRVKYPVIDGWYKKVTYHIDTGEGHDGYNVGASLGAGGTAVWFNNAMYKSEVYSSWKQFANGPIRVVFELTYGPWEVDGKKITEKKLISLDLGSRLFKVDDSFFADGKPAKLDVALGITTHNGKAQAFENRGKGWLYCWEKIDDFFLGTGVVISPDRIKEYKIYDSKKENENHAMFVVNTGDEGKFTYYAGYGWTKAKEITSREQWESYLDRFIETKATPVEITVK